MLLSYGQRAPTCMHGIFIAPRYPKVICEIGLNPPLPALVPDFGYQFLRFFKINAYLGVIAKRLKNISHLEAYINCYLDSFPISWDITKCNYRVAQQLLRF